MADDDPGEGVARPGEGASGSGEIGQRRGEFESPSGEVLLFDQDMAITAAEFRRCLIAAFPGEVVEVAKRGDVSYVGEVPGIGEVSDTGFRSPTRRPGWRIELTPLPDRVIALMRLPRHRVRILADGYDAAAAQRFLARFELYFRRGGG